MHFKQRFQNLGIQGVVFCAQEALSTQRILIVFAFLAHGCFARMLNCQNQVFKEEGARN